MRNGSVVLGRRPPVAGSRRPVDGRWAARQEAPGGAG
jgi:hypothetical protein